MTQSGVLVVAALAGLLALLQPVRAEPRPAQPDATPAAAAATGDRPVPQAPAASVDLSNGRAGLGKDAVPVGTGWG